jgi:CheY-like chemotaxis protein
MYKKFIPCLYFPTTVVLLDDERSFLSSVQSGLGKTRALRSFQTIESASEFLQQTHLPETFIERWKLHPRALPYFDDHVRDLDIDVCKIREEIYDPKRFEQVAVVIVDYEMPGRSGLEFCRSLQDKPFKKVLLTGEADEKIAVQAFNEGIIHQFIRKDDPDYLKKLKEAISDLEEIYFQDLSKNVMIHLMNNPDYLPYCLDDPCFVEFFNQCLVTYHPTEYYLTGSTGSFVFLDFEGVPSWLAVKDESEMQSHYETAALADKKPSSFVLKSLKDRQCVPYFYNEAEEAGEWDLYLHPSEIIKGKKTNYYTAYIEDPNAYQIKDMDKVLSYKMFLKGV